MDEQVRARIEELGRKRGTELAASGVVQRKAAVLRVLGWPEAVRQVQQQAKAS